VSEPARAEPPVTGGPVPETPSQAAMPVDLPIDVAVTFPARPSVPAPPPVPPVELPTRLELAWYQVARGICYGVAVAMWRYRVVGRENIPKSTAFVIAPSHRSYIDSPLAGCIVARHVRYMGKSGAFEKPLRGALFRSLGGFPVRRGAADREALRLTEGALAAGEPVVVFPEGGRRSGPVLGELLDGPAYVATRVNVPILPVGIGGTERAMPVGSKMARPGRVVLVVGKPLWPPALQSNGRVPRERLRQLTERLRVELQAVFDEARQLAGEGGGSGRPGKAN
jgi:1-acyl-sn-glycerol-3-phosphate acyltransferase